MTAFSRCEACPVAAEAPCVAERTRHRPYCDWAAAGGRWRDRVAELSGIEPATTAAAEAQPGPDVAAALAMLARMRACPFWSRCSCSGGRCALVGGATVSYRDCFACLETYE